LDLTRWGAVLAETHNALEVSEHNQPTRIYFPQENIAMAFLEPSDHTSLSNDKGTAHYVSIITKSMTLENVGWGYADPSEAVARLKDLLAFYTSDEVTVKQI
jgi:uncharacterized protein (DUF427 family)